MPKKSIGMQEIILQSGLYLQETFLSLEIRGL